MRFASLLSGFCLIINTDSLFYNFAAQFLSPGNCSHQSIISNICLVVYPLLVNLGRYCNASANYGGKDFIAPRQIYTAQAIQGRAMRNRQQPGCISPWLEMNCLVWPYSFRNISWVASSASIKSPNICKVSVKRGMRNGHKVREKLLRHDSQLLNKLGIRALDGPGKLQCANIVTEGRLRIAGTKRGMHAKVIR